jgi:linoleoyl-CoA desaturase
MAKPKFIQKNLEFTHELKKRVDEYFTTNNIAKTGNFNLYSKAIIIFVVLIATYIHLVFFTPPVLWAVLECMLLGFATAAIGFNIMHDGGHGSFSTNKTVNKLAAHTLDLLGGSSFMWNMKHNIIHHTYTNVEGVDDDIEAQPYMRMSPGQKKHPLHKYQHFYCLGLYALLYFAWIFHTDYKKYFTNKIGPIDIQPMKREEHIAFWACKLTFVAVFMLTPMYFVGFGTWLAGFAIFLATTGVLISVVFQLAHTVEHCDMIVMEELDENKIESEWTVHQLNTTANFATKNRIINWFTGGLNFQVEHHLFPRISHVHYPAISKIIKDTCDKYEIKYNEYNRMYDAFKSHLRFLKEMGVAPQV